MDTFPLQTFHVPNAGKVHVVQAGTVHEILEPQKTRDGVLIDVAVFIVFENPPIIIFRLGRLSDGKAFHVDAIPPLNSIRESRFRLVRLVDINDKPVPSILTNFGSCIEVRELYWFDPAADKQLEPTNTSSGALTLVVEDGNEERKSVKQPSRSENTNVVGVVEAPPNVGYQRKLCICFPFLVPNSCPSEYI